MFVQFAGVLTVFEHIDLDHWDQDGFNDTGPWKHFLCATNNAVIVL